MNILKATALATGILISTMAQAQDFPTKPTKVIFPNAAGGGFHTMLLAMQPMIEKETPEPLVVQTMPGAGTVTGTRFVAEQAPDGYTLLFIHDAVLQTGAMGTLGFETLDKLQPLARVITSCPGVFVRGDAEYDDLAGLKAWGDAHPGKLRGGVNIGALSHVQILALSEAVGTELRLVHVGGGAKTRQALLAGDVDVTVQTPASEVGLVKAGQEKALAVASAQPDRALPDAPTMASQGFDVPNAMCNGAYFWIRRDAPQDVKDYWSDTFQKVFSDADNANYLEETLGVEMSLVTGAEMDALGRELWNERSAIIKKYGIGQK